MVTFLKRLNSRVKHYLGKLFCLPGSIAVTNMPGKGASHENVLMIEAELSSSDQSQDLEFLWHVNQSMQVKVRVAEAAPPEGYIKLIQVLRKQIQ